MQRVILLGATYTNHNNTVQVIPRKIIDGVVHYQCVGAWHPCLLGKDQASVEFFNKIFPNYHSKQA